MCHPGTLKFRGREELRSANGLKVRSSDVKTNRNGLPSKHSVNGNTNLLKEVDVEKKGKRKIPYLRFGSHEVDLRYLGSEVKVPTGVSQSQTNLQNIK